jgi:uncharacterized spore protein YtfJ
MSETPNSQPAEPQNYEGDFNAAASLSASSLVITQETMERFLETADISAVYGEAFHHEDKAIIPTAEILCGMGFGVGSGGGSGPANPDGKDGSNGAGTGGGGGGGGRVLSRPVAVIVVSPSGVEVKPIVDVTKIAMAGLTAFGFVATMIYRMTRPGRH